MTIYLITIAQPSLDSLVSPRLSLKQNHILQEAVLSNSISSSCSWGFVRNVLSFDQCSHYNVMSHCNSGLTWKALVFVLTGKLQDK
jgi:hypothetical protein